MSYCSNLVDVHKINEVDIADTFDGVADDFDSGVVVFLACLKE